MSRPVVPSRVLRAVLWLDAGASALSAAPMIVAPAWLAGLTGLGVELLWLAGLALLPYVVYLAWLATRHGVPAAALWLPIVLNGLWAVDCGLLAFLAEPRPSALGMAFLALQASAVLVFAALQWSALRRTAPVLA